MDEVLLLLRTDVRPYLTLWSRGQRYFALHTKLNSLQAWNTSHIMFLFNQKQYASLLLCLFSTEKHCKTLEHMLVLHARNSTWLQSPSCCRPTWKSFSFVSNNKLFVFCHDENLGSYVMEQITYVSHGSKRVVSWTFHFRLALSSSIVFLKQVSKSKPSSYYRKNLLDMRRSQTIKRSIFGSSFFWDYSFL